VNTEGPGRRLRLFWVAGLTAVVALGLAPLSFHIERRPYAAVRLEGSESDYVAQQLATRFSSPFVDRVILVIQGLPPADSEEGTLTEGHRDLIWSLSSETRRSLLRDDGRATLEELLPAPWVSAEEQIRWVRELRRLAVADLLGMRGAKISIGGILALSTDYENAVGDRLPRLIALVVCCNIPGASCRLPIPVRCREGGRTEPVLRWRCIRRIGSGLPGGTRKPFLGRP